MHGELLLYSCMMVCREVRDAREGEQRGCVACGRGGRVCTQAPRNLAKVVFDKDRFLRKVCPKEGTRVPVHPVSLCVCVWYFYLFYIYYIRILDAPVLRYIFRYIQAYAYTCDVS